VPLALKVLTSGGEFSKFRADELVLTVEGPHDKVFKEAPPIKDL